MDATTFNGCSVSQLLPYDEIEIWHGDTDLYMNKLDEILNTPDDSHIECFVEADLRYPDDIKVKTKTSRLVLKIRLFLKIKKMII